LPNRGGMPLRPADPEVLKAFMIRYFRLKNALCQGNASLPLFTYAPGRVLAGFAAVPRDVTANQYGVVTVPKNAAEVGSTQVAMCELVDKEKQPLEGDQQVEALIAHGVYRVLTGDTDLSAFQANTTLTLAPAQPVR